MDLSHKLTPQINAASTLLNSTNKYLRRILQRLTHWVCVLNSPLLYILKIN